MSFNESPRFEWQIAISQSARADKTNHFFDRQFCPTVQKHVLSANFRLSKGPD